MERYADGLGAGSTNAEAIDAELRGSDARYLASVKVSQTELELQFSNIAAVAFGTENRTLAKRIVAGGCVHIQRSWRHGAIQRAVPWRLLHRWQAARRFIRCQQRQ